MVLADNGSTDGAPEKAEVGLRQRRPRPHRRQPRLRRRGQHRRPRGGRDLAADRQPGRDLGPRRARRAARGRAPLAARRPRSARASVRRPTSSTPPRAASRRSARGIAHALFGWVWPSNPWTASYRRERSRPPRSAPSTAGCPARACWCAGTSSRRSAASTPSYFMYFEDTDLCERFAARRLAERVRAVGPGHPRGRARDRGRPWPLGTDAAGPPPQRLPLPGPQVRRDRGGRRCGWSWRSGCSGATPWPGWSRRSGRAPSRPAPRTRCKG